MRVAGVHGVMMDEVRFNRSTDDSESDLVNCHTSNRCESAQLEYISFKSLWNSRLPFIMPPTFRD